MTRVPGYTGPLFGFTICEQSDPDTEKAWFMDHACAVHASAFTSLWDEPTPEAARRLGQTIAASWTLVGGEKPQIRETRLAAIEEITLLAAGLETLTDWKLREWKVVAGGAKKTTSLRRFQDQLKSVSELNPHITDRRHVKKVAVEGVLGRRTQLLWAIATTLYVRDRVQHGKAVVFTCEPTGPMRHSKVLGGLGVLPAAYVTGYSPLLAPNPASDQFLVDYANRVATALRTLRHEITPIDVVRELEGVALNSYALTSALLTTRVALCAGYLTASREKGPELWGFLAEHLAPGMDDITALE